MEDISTLDSKSVEKVEGMNEVIWVFSICAILSVAMLAALVVTWCLLPRWRSLQHYMAIIRIFYGTIFLLFCYGYLQVCDLEAEDKRDCKADRNFCETYISYHCKKKPHWLFTELTKIVYILSICWTSASLIVAYIRMVLRYTGVVHNEKKEVTLLTHVSAAAIYLVYQLTSQYIYNPGDARIANCGSITSIYFTLTMFNLFLFFKVTRGSLVGFKTSMGMALLCDLLTITVFFLVDCSPPEGFLNRDTVSMLRMVLTLTTAFKVIPQCLIILVNRSTRAEWTRYWMRRRNRQSNERM